MGEKPSKEQLARLQQARLRQQQTQARIESAVTESLVGWITRFIRPIVGGAVSAVFGWFARLFRGS